MNFNIVVLGGRIITNVEYTVKPTGMRICTFLLASSRRWGVDREAIRTAYVFVKAFDGVGELLAQRFDKGDYILVEGYLSSHRKMVDEKNVNLIDVVCERFQLPPPEYRKGS